MEILTKATSKAARQDKPEATQLKAFVYPSSAEKAADLEALMNVKLAGGDGTFKQSRQEQLIADVKGIRGITWTCMGLLLQATVRRHGAAAVLVTVSPELGQAPPKNGILSLGSVACTSVRWECESRSGIAATIDAALDDLAAALFHGDHGGGSPNLEQLRLDTALLHASQAAVAVAAQSREGASPVEVWQDFYEQNDPFATTTSRRDLELMRDAAPTGYWRGHMQAAIEARAQIALALGREF